MRTQTPTLRSLHAPPPRDARPRRARPRPPHAAPSPLDALTSAVRLQPVGGDTSVDPALVARGRALWADPATLAAAEPAPRPLRVALLLSGGVDSAVALHLLQAAGHDVTCFYLRIWFEEDFRNTWSSCPWTEDLAACAAVASAAGAPLRVVPLTSAYWDGVVTACVADLRAGRTPNPDVLCNARVKFGAFVDALATGRTAWETVDGESVSDGDEASPSSDHHHPLGGFDRVASGHYARVLRRRDPAFPSTADPTATVALAPAPDAVKDQTYFLARLTPAQLTAAVFPLGALTKSDVRALAASLSLPNAARPDSQGICFLGKVRFDEFVAAHLGAWPGPLVDADTHSIVGYHDGPWFFTPGQRRGVKLGGGPWYVTAKDMDTNVVYVSRFYNEDGGGEGGREGSGGEDNDAPSSSTTTTTATTARPRDRFRVAALAWLPGGPPTAGAGEVRVKVRHGPGSYACTLALDPPPSTTGSVLLDGRDQGLAPGQYAVFYQGGVCVGSGVIQ